MKKLAILTMMLLSSACATQPAVVDSACAWVRPIVLNDDELIVFAANIHTLRPLTDQINAQNTTRSERCK